MIKFQIRTSLLDQEYIFLLWTIEGEKGQYSRKVLISAIDSIKQSIVREEVYNRLRSLYAQRHATYNHTGYKSEEALKAVQLLHDLLHRLTGITNNKRFFDFAEAQILPHLHTIKPGNDSRYINYAPALHQAEAFILKCQKYFTNQEVSKNLQIIANQAITSRYELNTNHAASG